MCLSRAPPAMNMKQVVFRRGDSLVIMEAHQEPPTPRLLSAMFSSDGSSILLTFDSATNQGAGMIAVISKMFSCSLILQFAGVHSASCQWPSDPNTLAIYPGSLGTISVGSQITLRANVLKAQCSSAAQATCATWKFLNSTIAQVSKPANPIPPVISLAIPTTIGICSP